MKASLIKRLVLKDLRIHLLPLLGLAVAVPALGLSLALYGGDTWRHMGLILMSNSLIWLGFFLPVGTIIADKRLFVLSLPLTPVDWAVSKILGGLAMFLPAWLVFAAAMPAIVDRHPLLTAGSIAPIAALLIAFLVSFLLTEAVALASESTLITTGVGLLIVAVAFAVLPSLKYVPKPILEHWASDRLVWDPELVTVLALELLFGVGAVVVAFALLKRKRSFV